MSQVTGRSWRKTSAKDLSLPSRGSHKNPMWLLPSSSLFPSEMALVFLQPQPIKSGPWGRSSSHLQLKNLHK